MQIPLLPDLNIEGKKVLLRMDLDLPVGKSGVTSDYTRVESGKNTLEYLIENRAKIIIIGHKGRPGGIQDESMSLRSLVEPLREIIKKDVKFVDDILGERVREETERLRDSEILMLENLRFDKRESFDPAQDAGAEEFTRELASYGEIYVNEAFAVSHRKHASLVGIPLVLPHAAGLRFAQEIKHLEKIIENPERPLVYLISGIKKDKLGMIENIKNQADKVLVGGRLPEYFEKLEQVEKGGKVVVAQLNPDKEDITIHSIEKFEDEISKAKTIVLAGVIGKYEDEGQRQGTRRVFEAVANSSSYKVAGGGDTEAALTMFNLTDKFDWISVGGGAMLVFLTKGTLPGIQALIN